MKASHFSRVTKATLNPTLFSKETLLIAKLAKKSHKGHKGVSVP